VVSLDAMADGIADPVLKRDVAILQSGFQNVLQHEDVTSTADLKIVLSDGVFAGHRLVLASASPLIR
jgi:hypothetical protein